MFRKLWRDRRISLSRKTANGDFKPMTIPGYGIAPVTRDLNGGPEPANYGIPPDADERPPEHRPRHR
jgi:hypothetical protein